MLAVGEMAPDFEAWDQAERPFRLQDHRGKWVVLYFYPKDETPGCVAEACSFRDSLADLADQDVVVAGVSTQSIDSHQAFAAHHELNFPLLADDQKTVSHLYEAQGLLGLNRRITYIIDPEGRIVDAYRSETRPTSHVERVRGFLAGQRRA